MTEKLSPVTVEVLVDAFNREAENSEKILVEQEWVTSVLFDRGLIGLIILGGGVVFELLASKPENKNKSADNSNAKKIRFSSVHTDAPTSLPKTTIIDPDHDITHLKNAPFTAARAKIQRILRTVFEQGQTHLLINIIDSAEPLENYPTPTMEKTEKSE